MLQATDIDLGDNGAVRYVIDPEYKGKVPFGMNFVSGLIYTTEEFTNYFSSTTRLQYRFGITAEDKGAPPSSTSTEFIVS